MKHARLVNLVLVIAAALAAPRLAVSQLMLDNFSTGAYHKQLVSGTDLNLQSGSMIGGNRETVFFVCLPPCGLSNPFAQPTSFQIRPGTKIAPPALIHSAGYKVGPRLDVQYGSTAPLNLNLSATYDRIRVTFDASDLFVNFNILVFTGGLYSQLGCNLAAGTNPFTVDYPFASFTPGSGTSGADFSNLTVIDFIFQTSSAIGANDWAVTSFQAIPIGAPPADRTCLGL